LVVLNPDTDWIDRDESGFAKRQTVVKHDTNKDKENSSRSNNDSDQSSSGQA
jgi:hypothetical protein